MPQEQDNDNPMQWSTLGSRSKTLMKVERDYSATETGSHAVMWFIYLCPPSIHLNVYVQGTHRPQYPHVDDDPSQPKGAPHAFAYQAHGI